ARLPSEREYVLVVDERLRLLKGLVVAAEDGTPLAGATVATDSPLPGDGRVRASVVTRQGGTFAIEAIDGDYSGITLSAPGRCGIHRRVEEQDDDPRIALPRVTRAHGLVVSEKGPVAGAAVHVSGWTRVAGYIGFSSAGAVVTTDVQGRFEADVAPGDLSAWV